MATKKVGSLGKTIEMFSEQWRELESGLGFPVKGESEIPQVSEMKTMRGYILSQMKKKEELQKTVSEKTQIIYDLERYTVYDLKQQIAKLEKEIMETKAFAFDTMRAFSLSPESSVLVKKLAKELKEQDDK